MHKNPANGLLEGPNLWGVAAASFIWETIFQDAIVFFLETEKNLKLSEEKT